jgi:4-amino-4-deoxychorismate lyase
MTYPFFESIRLQDGQFENLALHEERMGNTIRLFYGRASVPDLKTYFESFGVPQTGLYKCRLFYGPGLAPPEFVPYIRKLVSSLKLVESAGCSYPYKFADRACIELLLNQRAGCDDILITRNGFLTDTSYCNIILKNRRGAWFTPAIPLFEGVRRMTLIREQLIEPFPIHAGDLNNYVSFKLVNAMINWEEAQEVAVENIIRMA